MSLCSPSFNLSCVRTLWEDDTIVNPTSECRILGCSLNSGLDSTNHRSKLVAFRIRERYYPAQNHGIRLRCVGSESVAKGMTGLEEGQSGDLKEEFRVLGGDHEVNIDGGAGDGSGGGDSFGNGGDGEDGRGGGDNEEEKEFGPILKFEEVMKETEARGVELPSDMFDAAKTTGIRQLLLERYLDLQVLVRLKKDWDPHVF